MGFEVVLVFVLGVVSFTMGRNFERAHRRATLNSVVVFERPAGLFGDADADADVDADGDSEPGTPDTAIEDMLFSHADVRDAVAEGFPEELLGEEDTERRIDEIMDRACERWRERARADVDAADADAGMADSRYS